MNSKIALILIGAAAAALLIFLVLSGGSGSNGAVTDANANNVTIVDGKQIVDVSVKGGYHPQHSVAKAGIPTVLRFNTNGTFDCSSSIRIASLGVSQILPSTGATDIALGTPAAGTLKGTCGMGMYSFEVEFQG